MAVSEEPIVALLRSEWTAIHDLCAPLSDAEWATPTALPGWTVQDNVSHIIGVERMLAGEAAPAVDVSHLAHAADPFAQAMETWIEARRSWTGAAVLADFDEITDQRITALQAMTDEEFAKVGFSPVGEIPYRDFMRVRVFDSWMHEQDIRRALGRPGHLTGPEVDVALERFEGALGFVVGKRAGAPDGSSVVFVVEGPTPRTYAVVVDGRAALVPDPPADPTATITLPLETFVALGGGRWDGAEAQASGTVRVEGDDALAGRVLAGMGFTP